MTDPHFKKNLVVADALIALMLEKDPHHEKAVATVDMLTRHAVTIIFPMTVFPEAITTLKRAFNQPEKAHLLNQQYQQGAFHVFYITKEVMLRASQLFEKTVSKRNTFFDALIAATAELTEADGIFSFDGWYPKLGLRLVHR